MVIGYRWAFRVTGRPTVVTKGPSRWGSVRFLETLRAALEVAAARGHDILIPLRRDPPHTQLRSQGLDPHLLDASLTSRDDGVAHATLRRSPYDALRPSRRGTSHHRGLHRAHAACSPALSPSRRRALPSNGLSDAS